MIQYQCHVFLIYLCLLSIGCGSGGGFSDAVLKKRAGGTLKDVAPIDGTVTLDGAPVAGIYMFLYEVIDGKLTEIKNARPAVRSKTGEDKSPQPVDKYLPTYTYAIDAKGKYCLTTYHQCDGIPVGEYRIAFKHMPVIDDTNAILAGDDLFEGRYSDPDKTEFKLTVEKGKPQKNLNFELKSK